MELTLQVGNKYVGSIFSLLLETILFFKQQYVQYVSVISISMYFI